MREYGQTSFIGGLTVVTCIQAITHGNVCWLPPIKQVLSLRDFERSLIQWHSNLGAILKDCFVLVGRKGDGVVDDLDVELQEQ
jgi:hypothetical protein